MMTLKDLHDRLLDERPSGAEHAADECPFCREVASDLTNNGGNGVSDKTFTEDEVKSLVTAAVAEAVKPLQDEIASHKEASTEAETEAKIAAIREELEAKVEEIQKSLDEATLKAEAASVERDELVAFLDSEKEKAEKEAETAKLREERTAKVAEVASFPEEYVKANTDRWASMEEDAFVALLEDYKAVAVKPSEGGLPASTTMNASREENKSKLSVVREIIDLRNEGIDTRAV